MSTELIEELKDANAVLHDIRSQEEDQWLYQKSLIIRAHESGMTYQQIADVIGVTKARVWQIVSGKRSGKA